MERTFKKSVQVLGAFSGALLLGILLLYTSESDPVVFKKYSIKYLLLVTFILTCYWSAIALLLKMPLLGRKGFQNVLLCALSLITTVLLAEVGFRAMDGFGYVRGSEIERWLRQVRRNELYTYCGASTRKKEYCITHENNSLGFNDKEYALEKPAGVYRILVVGDSYVEAGQVKLEDSFHKLMEARLNQAGLKTEVIAMGQSTVGTVKELETLETVGVKFKPDLVILGFLGANDVRDNSSGLNERRAQVSEPLVPPGLKKFLRARFDLGFFAADMIDRLNRDKLEPVPTDFLVFDPERLETDPAWQAAWDITFEAMLKIKALCEENGADFLVVSFTSAPEIASYRGKHELREALDNPYRVEELAEHYDFQLPDRRMTSFTEQYGIRYLQLNPIFASLRDQDGAPIQLHFLHDGHWNEQGHQAAAEAILDYLNSSLPQTMHQ